MAPEKKSLVAKPESGTPYQLVASQVLKATSAVLKHISSKSATSTGKQSLLDDADDASNAQDIRVEITTKKPIAEQRRLKPTKVSVPHPLHDINDADLKVCLITRDPSSVYDEVVKSAAFPSHVRARLSNPVDELDGSKPQDAKAAVIGIKSLRKNHGRSYEKQRQLYEDYDVLLADDAIVAELPGVLGKTFHKNGKKRPVPVNFQGHIENNFDEQGNKRQKLAAGGPKAIRAPVTADAMAREIERAVASALVYVSAHSVSHSVIVGRSDWSPEQLSANVEALVAAFVDKLVTKGWRGVKSIKVKGSHTAAMPVWETDELWEDDDDVLDRAPEVKVVDASTKKSRKRTRALIDGPKTSEAAEIADSKSSSKKRKSLDSVVAEDDSAPAKKAKAAEDKTTKAAQKEALKQAKAQSKAKVAVAA